MHESLVHVNGIDINVAENNRVKKQSLMLLHGIASWWQTFSEMLPAIEPDWHIYATDLRGCGKSGRRHKSYLLTTYIEDNLQILRHYIQQPSVLIGHSFGGVISMGIAAREPSMVRAIVSIDAPLFFREGKLSDTQWTRFFGRVIQLLQDHPHPDQMAAQLSKRQPDANPIRLKERATHLTRLDTEPISMHVTDQNMHGFDLNEVVRKVKCPIMILHADPEMSGASREIDLEWAQQQMPQLQIVRFKDAGHMLHETHAEEALQHILPFIAPYENS